jgi:hypothetical protein
LEEAAAAAAAAGSRIFSRFEEHLQTRITRLGVFALRLSRGMCRQNGKLTVFSSLKRGSKEAHRSQKTWPQDRQWWRRHLFIAGEPKTWPQRSPACEQKTKQQKQQKQHFRYKLRRVFKH